MYLTSHQARMWCNVILLWGPCRNWNSFMADANNIWPHLHSCKGALQMPSNQFNLVKQVKPGEMTPWYQDFKDNYNHLAWIPGGDIYPGFDTIFFYSGDLGEREVALKLRLVCCWTMLVIRSLGAMWTIRAFAKTLGKYSRWPCWS